MGITLNDDLLDDLVHKLSSLSIDLVKDICYDKCNNDQVQYLARAFTEILGVIIGAAPSMEVQQTYNNVCTWLQHVVAMNINLDNMMPNVEKPQLSTIFEDALYISKKTKDIN